MNKILKTIFEGAVYALTLLLILSAAVFIGFSLFEDTYWKSILAIIAGGLCFIVSRGTSQYITKKPN